MTAAHYPEGANPSQDDLVRALEEVVDLLDRGDVRYLLMGGVSSAAMARPRVTDDIDLFVSPDDARTTIQLLASAGFDTEEYDPSWLFKAWKYGVLVDVIFRSSGDIYLDEEMLARGRLGSFKGQEARLISPEDLLVIKAVAAAEPTPHHWYDALAIIARCDLDWNYIVARARQAGPRRVLSLLLYAESNDLAVPSEAVEALLGTVHPARGELVR